MLFNKTLKKVEKNVHYSIRPSFKVEEKHFLIKLDYKLKY